VLCDTAHARVQAKAKQLSEKAQEAKYAQLDAGIVSDSSDASEEDEGGDYDDDDDEEDKRDDEEESKEKKRKAIGSVSATCVDACAAA
jgi:hypothetical protein